MSLAACFLCLSYVFAAAAPEKREMTFVEVMKLRQISDPVISADGAWAAYAAQPDRGDGEGIVRSVKGKTSFKVDRGAKPVFSRDSRWVAFSVKPEALALEKGGKDKPRPGMALVRTADGDTVHIENVDRFAFSRDSSWLAYLLLPDEPKAGEGRPESDKEPKKEKGRTLVLRKLASGGEIRITQTLSFAFDESGGLLSYDRLGPEARDNGLYARLLSREGAPEKAVVQEAGVRYSNLAWPEKENRLAFTAAALDDQDRTGPGTLWIWEAGPGRLRKAVEPQAVLSGWGIPEKNRLVWTKDGRRLFFGIKPLARFDVEQKKKDEDPAREEDLTDPEKILAKREVDVWHWNDPLINSQQKKAWSRLKEKLYTSVYHLDSGRMAALAGEDVPLVEPVENSALALGLSDVPYLKDKTWDEEYFDLYLISLADGSRKKIASRLASTYSSRPSQSPGGRYVAYYDRRHWFLYDGRLQKTRNLTESLDVSFADEDHDTPGSPPGYGVAGWLEGDQAVLINDKFDVWAFPAGGGAPMMLTAGEGRLQNRVFRVVNTDPEAPFFKKGQTLLLSMVHERKKHYGFYSTVIGRPGVTRLLEEKKKFVFRTKAEKADVLLYTRESFDEFPDLWASDALFSEAGKISEANPRLGEFAWGSAELVEWLSLD
ncbi:MAG: hypothetical protein A2Y56_15895, partial [Candidatus Aminicenantes bacterium RBG_13_63_10]